MAYDGAKDMIDEFLGRLGLGSLGKDAWAMYTDQNASVEEIMLWVRGSGQYAQRFPAMADLAKDGRAVSEAVYMDYERTTRQLAQSYGLPDGMYTDPESIKKLLLADVSAAEMSDRMKTASAAAYSAPPEVRQALADQYGIGSGDLVGYWLDPDRAMPLIERQWAAAQLRGAAAMQQVETDREETERLAGIGVDMQAAYEGFGKVRATEGLGSSLGGEVASTQERTRGVFGDAAAARKSDRVARSRQAAFEGGSGVGFGQSGATGLGSAARG